MRGSHRVVGHDKVARHHQAGPQCGQGHALGRTNLGPHGRRPRVRAHGERRLGPLGGRRARAHRREAELRDPREGPQGREQGAVGREGDRRGGGEAELAEPHEGQQGATTMIMIICY